MVVVFENELQYFIIFWFGTKCDFTYREFPILDDLKNTDPEWIFKKNCQLPGTDTHNESLLDYCDHGNGQPGGEGYLPGHYCTDGWATYQL